MRAIHSRFVVAAVAAFALQTGQAADPPSITSFDIPGVAPDDIFVPGINDDGVVVGSYLLGTGYYGFIRHRDGRISAPIEVPGSLPGSTVLHSINDEGIKAGFYGTATSAGRGFVLDEARFSTYDYPGATATGVRSINNRGDLAGTYYLTPDASDMGFGFIATASGDPISFAPADPATTQWVVEGINDRRVVVGWAVDPSGNHGFVRRSDGSFVNVAYPGARVTHLFSINDCGLFAGWWSAAGIRHGLYGRADQLNSFDLPGAVSVSAYGINGRGQVTGEWQDANGALHGFVTAAIPGAGCDD